VAQILRLRGREYEILSRGEVLQLTAAGRPGQPMDPVAATGLLHHAATDPSAMLRLRSILAGQLGLHGMKRRSDRQVVTEFTRMLQSGRFVIRPAIVYPEGNPGRFIVKLLRTRVNDRNNPTVITLSLWQVMKTVPGTWLTAVAKYGDLQPPWPPSEWHRVYSEEWVQKCEPKDPAHDTEPDYHFWQTYSPGGRWEKGIYKPPRDAQPGELRDTGLEIDEYWCFKLEEVAQFRLPNMDTEQLKRIEKLLNALFEQAMAADEKKRLLERLNKAEKTVKAVGQAIKNEDQKREELKKLLEDLKKEVQKNASKKEVAEIIESWFRFGLRSLDESVKYKESMEERVLKEIEFLKFRCAEYDVYHEGEQKVEKIQKGTPEEDQWKKTPFRSPPPPAHRSMPPPSFPSPAPSPPRTGGSVPTV
jgi:hypothetical protein